MQGEIEKIQRKKERNNREKPRKPRVEDKCERQIQRQREMESEKKMCKKTHKYKGGENEKLRLEDISLCKLGSSLLSRFGSIF
jgi:hypothetical protein